MKIISYAPYRVELDESDIEYIMTQLKPDVKDVPDMYGIPFWREYWGVMTYDIVSNERCPCSLGVVMLEGGDCQPENGCLKDCEND